MRARFANLVPQQIAVSDVMRRYGCDRATANTVGPLPDIATVGAIPWRNPETVFRTIRHWMTPEDLQSLHKLMREHLHDS